MLVNEKTYRETIQKGIDYISSQVNPDGSVNPVEKGSFAYYKLPWALVVGGRPAEAARILRRIVEDTMTEEGDFFTEKRGKFHLDYYTYENAWLVLAAHLLSFFDISQQGWNYIERYQDPKTGGFCSKKLYNAKVDNVQDPLSTAWVCNVALQLGKVEVAEKAAGFVKMIWDIQPEIEKNFYYYWQPQGGLVTEKPAEEPEDRYFRISKTEPENWYYILGAQISFMARLYIATGKEEYLTLAKRIRDFGMGCHQDIFGTDSSGKFGYGNTYLYYATGDKQYLEVAQRCADYLAEDQHADGYWERGGKPTASSTSEFCVWLMSLLEVTEALDVKMA